MSEEVARFEDGGGDFVRSEEFHVGVEEAFKKLYYPVTDVAVEQFVTRYNKPEDAKDVCEIILGESNTCLGNPDAALLVVARLQPELNNYFLKQVAEEVLRRNTRGIGDDERPNQNAVRIARELLGSGE